MEQSEKRKFARCPLDLTVTVSVQDISGELHREETTLCDASGGGLRFTTRHMDWYLLGREIEISIDLPQSGNIRAHMIAHGRVVRTIDTNHQLNGKFEVAIILLAPLHFERSS